MADSNVTHPKQEKLGPHPKNLLCWKATFGGLLIALMAFVGLTSLGAGIAGFTAEGLISQRESGSSLATGSGLYLGISIVVALFCGGYFAMRISRFMTTRVGAAHGLVVASAFFLLMILGLGNLVGGLASGFGSLAKASANGISNLASNSMVQDTVNEALGAVTFKSPLADVAQGLTTRMLQGNTESAKKFLAYQTNLPPSVVDTKIAQMKTQLETATRNVAETTAHAVGNAGLSFFVVFLVGLIGAVLGGRTGAHANADRPLSVAPSLKLPNLSPELNQNGSIVPYIFGWLLGVPVSILFLIAMFRTVF